MNPLTVCKLIGQLAVTVKRMLRITLPACVFGGMELVERKYAVLALAPPNVCCPNANQRTFAVDAQEGVVRRRLMEIRFFLTAIDKKKVFSPIFFLLSVFVPSSLTLGRMCPASKWTSPCRCPPSDCHALEWF